MNFIENQIILKTFLYNNLIENQIEHRHSIKRQLYIYYTVGESWMRTTHESPICETITVSSPINITVAVEPDSTSSPVTSSLYKMKHHRNLECNNIKSTIILNSCNLGKLIFSLRLSAYQFNNLVSALSKAFCNAS